MNAVDPNVTINHSDVDPGNSNPADADAAPEVATAVTTDAIKAERYAAANKALEDAAKAETAKAAAELTAAKEAEAAKVREADVTGKLTEELAVTKAKAALLEPKAKSAEHLDHAAALAKSGKHWEAIQYLQEQIGVSFDAAVQQVINPGQEPVPVTGKEDDKTLDPVVAELKSQVEALTNRVKEADAKEAAMAKEAGRRSVVDHVKAKAKEFPFLASNEEWITEALAAAEPEYAKAIEENKGEDLSVEAKNDLIIKALAKAETKHKAAAELYASVTKPVAAPKKPTDVPKLNPTLALTGSTRAGITPAAKTGQVATLEELKRARRQAN